MNRSIALSALSSAVAGICLLSPVAVRAADAPAPPAVATEHGLNQADVPVRDVVLFSSGVGYFEHFGTVHGSGSTELRFKTQQINDILKSLVLQDLDKGKVTTITYPSQDPIAKTLRSFQVDITSNPSMHELLEQLRGARVKLTESGSEIQGTILGVEKKQRPVGDPAKGQVLDVWAINLIEGANIRSVDLDDVSRIELEDPQLRGELARALAALAQARDQDKKPVQIHFEGEGERRVRIGYVVETPVWKTSYRLIIDGAGPLGDNAPARPPEGKGADSKPAPAAGAAAPSGNSKLQGWAIVENQTDNDWNDVQLSLVSGRPISFIQDLYQPLYVPRPVVQPELYASLRPQTYDAGEEANKDLERFAAAGAAGPPPMAPPPAAAPAVSAPMGGLMAARQMRSVARKQLQEGLAFNGGSDGTSESDKASIDAAASIASVASASKVGELFQYTVGSVTLPRQRSAMIPIVTDSIEVERVSIYNPTVLPKNPLNGARVKNTTGKHLLAGPITVLEGGAYAGDASIDNVPPGQERLISYGIDLQVRADATQNRSDDVVQTGKIVKGVLFVSRKHVFSQDYQFENKSDRDKSLIVEHPLRQGWKLVDSDKPIETTESLYRFRGHVAAGKATKLTVKEELIDSEQIALLPTDVSGIELYARTGEIPPAVRDVLLKAVGFKNAMAATEAQIAEHQKQVAEITQEQTRIRENMKTVAQNSDYYGRLLKKLDEQETKIEKLQSQTTDLQQSVEKQRKDLEDYLTKTTVS